MKIFGKKKAFRPVDLVLLGAVILAAIITFVINIGFREDHQHFIELAQSFLHGRVDLIYSSITRGDIAPFNGKAYWPLGPFPAIVLIPFVYLTGSFMTVGLLALPLIFLTGLVIAKIAAKVGYSIADQWWLMFAFLFVSPYLGIAWVPRSWQFAHVVAVLLLFLSLYEFHQKKRYWVIGLLLGALVATRAPAIFCASFFALDLVWERRHHLRASIRPLVALCSPIAISFLALLLYNHARFGSFFEFGYAFANLGPDLSSLREYGVLSVRHIPVNLYYFLVAPPSLVRESVSGALSFPYVRESIWGVGLLFSAPYYFSLLWKRYVDRENMMLLVACLITAIPVLMYFGIGPFQLSFRYALDFLPILFLVLMRTIYHTDGKITFWYKAIILLAFALSFYLFAT